MVSPATVASESAVYRFTMLCERGVNHVYRDTDQPLAR